LQGGENITKDLPATKNGSCAVNLEFIQERGDGIEKTKNRGLKSVLLNKAKNFAKGESADVGKRGGEAKSKHFQRRKKVN